MMHVRNMELEIPLGRFRDVIAVMANRSVVSVIDRYGWEHMLSIQPRFSGGWQDLRITGEFGDPDGGRGGQMIPGINLQDVTDVSIDVLQFDPGWDFHIRSLKIRTDPGITLTWELQCVGRFNV